MSKVLSVQPGDWPAFRGPNRDSVVRGAKIATDWQTAPPKLLWRQRVGPGWSSFAVVGDRLFTQEQRGPSEAVVCLEAATGREIWAYEDAASFSDAQAGPGPRATPTFAEGRIYALGATGILNCLDAATGERAWSHDVAADAGAKLPVWGFVSSPLVVKGVVVVSAEGDRQKTLLAYRADSGEPAWTADVGKISYGSPQPASLHGAEQILFLGERGLMALDPATGKIFWEHSVPTGPAMPHSLQPHPLGESQILIAFDHGATLIDVKRDGEVYTPSQRWTSRALKPTFNDFVVHKGSIYGFDGAIFCCVEVQTGESRWKEGRYDHGQVLLLADQNLLLVISEKGEAILLAANPEEHKELGRFQAIKGKTWNHPVIAHGRLFVRNAEEMACYELAASTGKDR
jgi:outer membrane protein assembly factor BamB